LTHKRPKLFQRCLKSALNKIPVGIEVLVLNDSGDIEEVHHDQVQYFYKTFNNLSENYKFLLERATNEFVYYLEDDDYLVDNFYEIVYDYLDIDSDIIGGNYYPIWNDDWVMKCTTTMNKGFTLDPEVFQLGQFIMRRSKANTFNFPLDSHIHNDRKLVDHILSGIVTKGNIPKVLYYQTIDGNDNISFPESRNYYGI
jgi:hypothetical protein